MQSKLIVFVTLALASLSSACTKEIPFNAEGIFNEFWTFADENYIFFQEKDIDWTAVQDQYLAQIDGTTTEDELFDMMGGALLELKDNHSWIYRPDEYGPYYNYQAGYEIHFDPQLVKEQYVQDSLGQRGQLYWGLLNPEVGYIYWPKFQSYAGFGDIIRTLKDRGIQKLIIDVRGNGGGDSNAVPAMLGDLVQERTYLGAYGEKTGPGHDDVSNPVPIYAEPNPDFNFDLPIIVLTNRDCYSATTYFAAMIKGLPQVTLMGQITGGGAGGNLGYQLSNGWLVAVSVSDFVDKDGLTAENGVAVDVAIENTAADLAAGKDRMLEMAVGY